MGAPKRRKFGGKSYNYYLPRATKSEAEQLANKLRSFGYNVRIVYYPPTANYLLYRRVRR